MSTTPTVYVICDQNCKFEGMTKEQIYTAIVQAVNEGTIGDIDTGFITTVKTINGTPLKFFVGTQDEYDALTEEDKQNLFAIISNDATREGILATIETLQADLTSLDKRLTEDEKAMAEIVELFTDHANHEFLIAGKYTITNGAGTLSTGDVNKLEDGGIYMVALYKTSGSSTITYSGIMLYQNHEGFLTNIIYVGNYKIVFTGDFIECEDLTLNGYLYCYKIGTNSGYWLK